jgi:hypothetical protein
VLYYPNEDGLGKYNFEISKVPKTRTVRLFMGSDGNYDVLYTKSYIKSAGISQSVLMDVNSYIK